MKDFEKLDELRWRTNQKQRKELILMNYFNESEVMAA